MSCTADDKPFVFISYAHSDAFFVFQVLEGVPANDYNIWYDQGIEINTKWTDEIANAILASKAVVVFVTKISMASRYVRSEVEFAISKKVNVIPVYLESMDVLPPGLELMLHSMQGIKSNNVDETVSKLCRWLKYNVQQTEQPVKPPAPVSPKPLTVVKNQSEQQDESENNFRHSGLHVNQEKYEQYSDLKNRPEENNSRKIREQYKSHDQNAEGAHAVSHRPYMSKLLKIIFFVNIVEIFTAFVASGIFQRPFITALINWGLPAAIFYWYFFRRDTMHASFFDNLLPNPKMLRSVLYWAFLLGWLATTLNPDSLKIWLPHISRFLAFIQIKWDVSVIISKGLPQVPKAIKSIGFFASLISGAFLVLDAAVTAIESLFATRA